MTYSPTPSTTHLPPSTIVYHHFTPRKVGSLALGSKQCRLTYNHCILICSHLPSSTLIYISTIRLVDHFFEFELVTELQLRVPLNNWNETPRGVGCLKASWVPLFTQSKPVSRNFAVFFVPYCFFSPLSFSCFGGGRVQSV